MRRDTLRQKGMASMEFALVVLLVLVPLLAGTFDVSTYMRVGQAVNRAAREGAVLASRNGDPLPAVVSHIQSAGLDPSRLTTEITGGGAEAGEPVGVSLSYDLAGMSVFPCDAFLPEAVTARATARHE